MTTKITSPDDGIRAGRFVLAQADNDGAKLVEVLKEATATDTGVLGLCLELSAIVTGLAEQGYGPNWRSILVTGLNDLDLVTTLADIGDEGEEGQA